jgi:hypothetical protein
VRRNDARVMLEVLAPDGVVRAVLSAAGCLNGPVDAAASFIAASHECAQGTYGCTIAK